MVVESFSIRAEESLPEGIARVLRERTDAALQELAGGSASKATTVHEVRKRLKELRAGLRLVRAALDPDTFTTENAGLRDIGRPLSEARDAEVMLETLASLRKHFKDELAGDAFKSVQQALQRRRREIVAEEVDTGHALEVAAAHLQGFRGRLDQWHWADIHWPALAHGLQRIYRKGRRAMQTALDDGHDDSLHEWRKRVKDLRYQLTMLQPIWPAVMEALASEAHTLGGELGEDHDLAVLSNLLDGDLRQGTPKPDRQALQGLIARRRETHQHHAKVLGERIYAEKPKQFVDRFNAYWRATG